MLPNSGEWYQTSKYYDMETINLAEKYNQQILISMQALNNMYVCLMDFGLVFHAPVRIICSLCLLCIYACKALLTKTTQYKIILRRKYDDTE